MTPYDIGEIVEDVMRRELMWFDVVASDSDARVGSAEDYTDRVVGRVREGVEMQVAMLTPRRRGKRSAL